MASRTPVTRTEKIRHLAHQLWEQDGRPEGRAEYHWFQAEAMVIAEPEKPKKKSAPAKSKAKKV